MNRVDRQAHAWRGRYRSGVSGTPASYDVIGIGNALVDVITHADDKFLDAEELVKGSMTLIETDRAVSLYRAMGSGVEMSGGSAANTMTGVASFGGSACFVGKVAEDDLGDVFGHDLRAVGVAFPNKQSNLGVPTGRCLIVVTPDAQRTMNTYLGVSSLLGPEDVDTDLIGRGKVLYMEGYLWDRPEAKAAYRKAAAASHAANRKVSLSLSDSFCVDRHRDDFRSLVTDSVDVLFGNEDELLSLYEVTSFDDAVRAVRADCELAAITRSASGSVIITHDEVIAVPAEPCHEVVDTTGAGDLYAAGFLFGFTQSLSLAECGRLGSLAASEVISHVGARPLVELNRFLDGHRITH
jgi:sugar/nucleoside kinase (ribokinase family)